MIAAILTCVFVVYLYLTLNEQDEPSAGPPSLGMPTTRSDLAARLDRLEDRIQQITQQLEDTQS